MALAKTEVQHGVAQHLTALPQQLLECILIYDTSTADKKALRQTCKLFKQTLDCNITCILLTLKRQEDQRCMETLLKHLQPCLTISAIALYAQHNFCSLLKHLPEKLTTLRICGNGMNCNMDLKELRRLPHLTFLYLADMRAEITGMEYITGLTRLHVRLHYHDKIPVGFLAHLAPTLKHLSLWRYEDVQDMDQLTNLEVLELESCKCIDFFSTHRRLPLKHLSINPKKFMRCSAGSTWESAPTTLTQLTFTDSAMFSKLDVLPSSITHLQLLDLHFDEIEFFVRKLPGLTHLDLDLCMYESTHPYWTETFSHLSKLTNLQALRMCVEHECKNDGKPLPRETVLSILPEVAMAVERGVQLVVVPQRIDLWGVRRDPTPRHTTWAKLD